MNRNEFPQWAKVVVALVAIVVLGPPVLGLAVGLIGLAIGLAAVALKFGVIALGVFAVFVVLRALFASPEQRRAMPVTTPMVDHEEGLRRDDEELRALDAELARVMAAQGKAL